MLICLTRVQRRKKIKCVLIELLSIALTGTSKHGNGNGILHQLKRLSRATDIRKVETDLGELKTSRNDEKRKIRKQ